MSSMVRNDRRKRSVKPGFTLVELLVVLTIMALLVGLVAPRVLQYLGKAKTDTAQTQLRNVAAALDLYRLDMGRYPLQSEGLVALVKSPAGATTWNGPYLQNESGLSDPWGEEFQYRVPGEHGEFDLFSYGADKASGGEGEDQDVVNW